MKQRLITLLLFLSVFLSFSYTASAAPVQPANDTQRMNGFYSNPDQDSGWVRADVVGGGCDNNGNCSGTVTPGSPTLYEYVPDRERVDQDPRLNVNLSQHGGDTTAYARQICTINGQQQGWSAGTWHHGATWTKNTNGTWSGPSRPHWAFDHDDRCRLAATPTPRPTNTPVPTATPQPGRLTVAVYACGVPFAGYIEWFGPSGSAGSGSGPTATFTVPSGATIRVVAHNNGDPKYAVTEGSGTAGSSIRIDLTELRPCSGPPPTPPPSMPTPTPPPPPPCTVVNTPNIIALVQSSPAPSANFNAPTLIPVTSLVNGTTVLQFTTAGNGKAAGDTSGVSISIYDVTTAGTAPRLATGEWNRPFVDRAPTTNTFSRNPARTSGWTALSGSRGSGFDITNGWLKLTTPALQAGHIYQVRIFSVQGFGCNTWNVYNYFKVEDPAIVIRVRKATMTGVDAGPIPNRLVTWFSPDLGARTMTTDANGTVTMQFPTLPNKTDATKNFINIRPDVATTDFVWKIDGTCTTKSGVILRLDAQGTLPPGALTYLREGGCNVTFWHIPLPTIASQVLARENGSAFSGFGAGTVSLVASDGTFIGSTQPSANGTVTFTPSSTTARRVVGNISFALSYAPPSATPAWNQLPPRAGTAGDSITTDRAITFPAGSSNGNQFFIERTITPQSEVSTIGGTVSLINLDSSVTNGPYGTVQVSLSTGQVLNVPASSTGVWQAQVSLATTATVSLRFTKNLDSARYFRADVGRINNQASGTALVGANQIIQITLPPKATGIGYNFVIAEVPPPPPPPVASGELKLWMHSHLDSTQGVYLSTNQTLSWPAAEVGDFSPNLKLAPLPADPFGYRYEQKIIGWSFNETEGKKATDRDALNRTGCRAGDQPPSGSGDLSLLRGCVYRYSEKPSADEMSRQARIHWSQVEASALNDTVYAYRIDTLRSTNIAVSVLVETAVVDTTTGQRWTSRQSIDGSFVVNLVAPRTLK